MQRLVRVFAVLVVLVVLVVLGGLGAPGCGPGVPASPSPRAGGPAAAPPPAVAEAAAGGDPCAADRALAAPNRPLTAGERALLRPIFRDGIDYDRVRVIDAPFPFQPPGTYMTPCGHVHAPGPLFRADFSLPGLSRMDRAELVHEIGHVWQFANGVDLVAGALADFARYRGDYEQAYPYRLEPGRDLTDYGLEQQASILEDYYLLTAHERPYRMQNRGLSARQRDRLFAAVLRKFLVDPRYARPG